MRVYFNEVKNEIDIALARCNNNSNWLSRLLGYGSAYVRGLYKNNKLLETSTVSSEFVERVREFNKSNISLDKDYYEITDEIRDKLREAYNYFPSYRGICKRVLGYANPNSCLYHELLSGKRKNIHIRYLNNLDKFLEEERKRATS